MMVDDAVLCSACGHSNAAGGRFCVRCGYALTAEAAAQAAYAVCPACRGNGRALAPSEVFCPTCRWLRPLGENYVLPAEAFMWALDAQAMGVLRSIGPLSAAAQALSNRIGRPWFEATVNGIRLGPDQLPDIFEPAVLAARIMGLQVMPEVYISGESMWEAQTLGSETSAFVCIGSVLSNMKGKDLLYVLGREMGHCAAHHALWQTVLQFMSGKKQINHSLMGQGVLQFLNPSRLLESAIDTPLMAWARHAEITADRAGALVVRDFDVVRRVSTQWTVRSFPIFNRLNLDALERQVAEADDRALQVAEWAMTARPYLSRRLRFLGEYVKSETYTGWKAIIDYWLERERAVPPADPGSGAPPGLPDGPPPDTELVRLTCPLCQHGLKVPAEAFGQTGSAKIRCPNPDCAKVLEVKHQKSAGASVEKLVPEPADSIRLTCPACRNALRVPKDLLAGRAEVLVRCPNPACKNVLTVKPPPSPGALKGAEESPLTFACLSCGRKMSLPRDAFGTSAVIRARCPNPECRAVIDVAPPTPGNPDTVRVLGLVTPLPATLRLTCAACNKPLRVPRTLFRDRPEALVRCPNPECRAVLTVKAPPPEKLPVEPTSIPPESLTPPHS